MTRSENDANQYMAATRCNAYRPAMPRIYAIQWRGVVLLIVVCALVGYYF